MSVSSCLGACVISRVRVIARVGVMATAIILFPRLASADAVADWNEKAFAAATQAKQLPFAMARSMAMVHTAMFDAVNSVEGRYRPYKVKVAAAPGSSAEAACVAAAHGVLVKLFPEQQSVLDAAYTESLKRILDGSGKTSGVSVGEEVAAKSLALRGSDGAETPNTYRPPTTAGRYIATSLPVGSQWGNVTPWVMDRGSQFRPGPPPPLTSAEWAADYNEVKDIGAKKSSVRTSEQTDIARFWVIVGPASWDPVVRQLAAAPGRNLLQNARLFALAEMAGADAYIAVCDAKYAFQFWRPITAIRNGDIDGNEATVRVADWEPVIDTPMHPEYPCAHCITSAAVAVVLQGEFGNGTVPTVTMTSPTALGVTRTWKTIQDWADEVSAARIYGGIHYRNSVVVGKAMGKKIGELTTREYLKPL
jgi:hypothetical protein